MHDFYVYLELSMVDIRKKKLAATLQPMQRA